MIRQDGSSAIADNLIIEANSLLTAKSGHTEIMCSPRSRDLVEVY